MDYDIVIVGGGSAGLSFARAMAGTGLSIAIVVQQVREALADPAYDGREIALTHHSVRSLSRLDAWQHLSPGGISELGKAHVLNGNSRLALPFVAHCTTAWRARKASLFRGAVRSMLLRA